MALEILNQYDFYSCTSRVNSLLQEKIQSNFSKIDVNTAVQKINDFNIQYFICNQFEINWKKQNYLQNPNVKMQGNPYETKTCVEKEESEETHQFNCACYDCQVKYGSLPVLVQVIEGQEELQCRKTEENHLPNTDDFEPTPSTSFDTHSCPRSPKKDIKCSHCDKTFTHKGDYNKHLRIHTGEQPYSCPTCNRKFAHTSNLSRHLKVHSGDRPFVCDVCHKTFSRMDKLKLHKQTKICKKNVTNL